MSMVLQLRNLDLSQYILRSWLGVGGREGYDSSGEMTAVSVPGNKNDLREGPLHWLINQFLFLLSENICDINFTILTFKWTVQWH